MEAIENFIKELSPLIKVIGFSILTIVVIGILGIVHYEWSTRRQKRHRKLRLQQQGRLIDWNNVRELLSGPSGTLICFGVKDPEIWWTEDNLFETAANDLTFDLNDDRYNPLMNFVILSRNSCRHDDWSLVDTSNVETTELQTCLMEFDDRRRFVHAGVEFDCLPDRHRRVYEKRESQKLLEAQHGVRQSEHALTPPESPN